MGTSISPIAKAERALAEARTPAESKVVESLAAAAKAWAREQKDFGGVIAAARIYILARRKTTELILPGIKHGGHNKKQPDNDVRLLEDYGLTDKQWSRRTKELDVTTDDLEAYIDDCVQLGVEPTVFGLLRFALQIIGDSTGNEWWTPSVYIESARAVLGKIDLDPASCAEANDTVKATKFYSEDDDGLVQDWKGRVFMNPPYSANQPFTEKLLREYAAGKVTAAVVLLGAHAIETKWFAPYWDAVLCFTGKRIKFNTPTGPAKAGNIAGSVFVYLGEDQRKFADEFGVHGAVVKRWP